MRVLLVLAWMLPLAAFAEPVAMEFGRYLAKYPGMYSTWTYSADARDRTFAQNGEETDSAAPTFGSGVAFPEQRGRVQLEWHFPWFEAEAIPFISSRTWTARATLGYSKSDTDGPIQSFIAAEKLVNESSGFNDVALAFGPSLIGGDRWRTQTQTPFSLLLLFNASIPTGERDPDSPNNTGSNVFSYGATLGAHAQWQRLLFDAGLAHRRYAQNEEPAFGAHEPTRRGADTELDLSVAGKLLTGWYLSGSLLARDGDPNEYEGVRFSRNPPSSSGNVMETFPDPGVHRDGGTEQRRLDLAAHWFARPDLRLSLHYVKPLSGSSGEFDLRYLEQRENCRATNDCDPQPNGTDRVDGLGAARSYASDYWMLTITYSHEQGDFWL